MNVGRDDIGGSMKAIVHDCHTEIFPTNAEAARLCKPGAGADTCIWITFGGRGFESTLGVVTP